MVDTELLHCRLPTPQDAEVAEYQAVSILAVVGLFCGLLAVTARLSPAMWFVALAGVVVNSLALRQIARAAPLLLGRKAALVGLNLSIFFGAVATADWYTYNELVRREAQQFASLWFDSLRNREPQKAHQLAINPAARHPLDDKLWSVYYEGSEPRQDLQAYIERPEIKTLMALGDQAQVRYYVCPSQGQEKGNDIVSLVYAVTFPEAGAKKTFFLKLVLERHHLTEPSRAEWRIVSADGGVGPDGRERR